MKPQRNPNWNPLERLEIVKRDPDKKKPWNETLKKAYRNQMLNETLNWNPKETLNETLKKL